MRPLDPLGSGSSLAHLLRSAAAAHVRVEIARVEASTGGEAAALLFARGALALREGDLVAARADLGAAGNAFAALDEVEAAALAGCEAHRASILGGGPAIAAAAAAQLATLAAGAPSARVRVVALHTRGIAERATGDLAAAQRALLDALREAEPFPEEHAQILGTLGALYVELGAFGAAVPLLEQAALLHDESGDAAGEAAVHGELGVAARALRDLDAARLHFERQEWLASRLGHAASRARALALLAGLALESRRAADATELAGLALEVPGEGDPRVAPWAAHAGAIAGDGHAWFGAAWTLASLGHVERLAGLLGDRAAAGVAAAGEAPVLAALLPHAPRRPSVDEAALEALVAVAARRVAAQRNLGRLAALSIAQPGLLVAALAAAAVGDARRALPSEQAAATAVAELPGVAVWVWPAGTPPEAIGRDLAAARAALGDDLRAVLVLRPRARVLSPPFPGEVGAQVRGVDAVPLVRAVSGLEEGELVRGVDVPWSPEAQAQVTAAGFVEKA